jgi:hypothetical protein
VLDRRHADSGGRSETANNIEEREQAPPTDASADSPTTDHPSGGGGGNQLVRVTVNLTQRAYSALERASDLTGDNRTDTINRALLVYALIQDLTDQGGGTLTIVNQSGEKERIHIL